MKGKRRILFALFVALLGGLPWLLLPPRDPLFHGKPESYWIDHLSHCEWSLAQDQVEQWQEFGPDGVRVLVRALNNANRPLERAYRAAYGKMRSVLPRELMRRLPAPRSDSTRVTRYCVVDLLGRLGKEAKIATSAVARALKDEDLVVRHYAIRFFTAGGRGGENSLLNQMEEKEKRKLLPDFIRAMQEKEALDTRYNAAVALGYYPEQREIVAPVLLKALQDSTGGGFPDMGAASAGLWVVTVESLHRIAPQALIKAGFVRLLVQTWKDPDRKGDWVAELLGEMRAEPAVVVPALIESLESTNTLWASIAAKSLVKFKQQADTIIPALERAARREDSAGSYAKAALQQLESDAPRNQGVKQ